ncbi:MAG: primosomal protein N' [Chlorobiaceae bacterium]|nr:primosomal protein N' [Chlorobiaceae bacterium]
MFIEVVFPLHFRKAFTYSVPKELENYLKPGIRVVAPFGPRVMTGVVVSLLEQKPAIKEEIKAIQDVLDFKTVVSEKDFHFYQWLSDYYLCGLGESLKLAFPQGTDIESKKRIIPDKEFSLKLFSEEENKTSIKAKILKVVSEKDSISLRQLQKLVKKKNIYSVLKKLESLGAITVHNEVEEARVKEKKVTFIKLAKPVDEIYSFLPEFERRSAKQFNLLLKLISLKAEIPLSELIAKEEISRASVKSLENKGFVRLYEKRVERIFSDKYFEEFVDFKLTEDQTHVIGEVTKKINEKKFSVTLLHGVTGSGKTQVYIELIKHTLQLGKTVILLVPEISLTPQITNRLKNNFGEEVSVVHSKMSLGERFDTWEKILDNKSKVIIGARSALFSPLQELGLIIVDEEHDNSYKQDDQTPKYQARDAAIMKGKFFDCPVLLGSATPSIESMYNALSQKYSLLELPQRVDDAQLPKITLVNVVDEKKNKRMENVFSQLLLSKIDDRLKKKEGIIILQNRRGFATQIYCLECANIEFCDSCSVSLVFHINEKKLRCHYCDFEKKIPENCSQCGSKHLKYFGTGTERVEDELAIHFPEAIISRIDSDSISKKGNLGNILRRFRDGEINILVGTQIVSKGMDFPHVTLVGVVSAETNLWMPDFRADERTFQLLTQVAGRSGRSKIEGEVVIQTQNDKHFVLRKVIENDYKGFYEKEILDRNKRSYPPFMRLALIEAKDKNESRAKEVITDFYNEIKKFKNYLVVTSPTTAIIAKLKDEYRFQILIKSSRLTDPGGGHLRQAITMAFEHSRKNSKLQDVKVFFDIDPQNIL